MEPDTERTAGTNRTRALLIVVALALLSAAIAGAATWFYQKRTIDRLESEAEKRTVQLETLASKLRNAEARLRALEASAAADSLGAGGAASPGAASGSTPKPKVEKQFTFITKVKKSGESVTLFADYAQLFTGDAAAQAATEHGDESPPPNDYYIVNDNPKLRVFDVLPAAKVRLTTTSEGTTVGTTGYAVSLGEFVKLFNNTPAIRDAPYTITLTGGKVSAVEEMYVP